MPEHLQEAEIRCRLTLWRCSVSIPSGHCGCAAWIPARIMDMYFTWLACAARIRLQWPVFLGSI